MASSIINSDDGVISGTSGLKSTGGDDGVTAFQQNGTERMRIDSSGNLIVGGTSALNSAANRGNVTIRGSSSRIINFGSASAEVGYIVSDSAGLEIRNSENLPLILSANNAEKARITGDGYLRMASGTGGIQFNGDTAAANALDDYEEGTWTPTLPNGGTLSVQVARYVKIGSQVTVSFFSNSVVPTNNASEFQIGGLPFANGGYGNLYFGGSFGYVGDSNLSGWLPITGSNNTYIYFHVSTGNVTSRTNANYLTAASGSSDEIILTITYFAAS